jgi:hypothetical protein
MHLLEPPAPHAGIYLALVSRTVIYLFETPPDKRSFSLAKELYTPQPARSVALLSVKLDRPKKVSTSAGELALFAGMADRAVLILLSDSSVMELELPSTASPVSSTSRSFLGRTRSRTRTNSFSSSCNDADTRGGSLSSRFSRRHSMSGRNRAAVDSVDSLKEALGLGCGSFWACSALSSGSSAFHLITRDRTTYAVRTPLVGPSDLQSATSRYDAKRGLTLEPVFEWRWKSKDLVAVHASLRTQQGKQLLVLTAVTTSGFEVQEGYVDLDSGSARPFFVLDGGADTDLDSAAQYDFGAQTALLGVLDPFRADEALQRQASTLSMMSTSSGMGPTVRQETGEQGCLLWVAGLKEYKLRYVG